MKIYVDVPKQIILLIDGASNINYTTGVFFSIQQVARENRESCS